MVVVVPMVLVMVLVMMVLAMVMVLLLLMPTSPPAQALKLEIVNLNYETVRLTWYPSAMSAANLTVFFSYGRQEPQDPCPRYVLQEHLRVGCELPADGDRMLFLALWNGSERVLTRRVLVGSYWVTVSLSRPVKPPAPGGLRFRWREDAVMVTCSDLPYEGLSYEVQLRGTHDKEWQVREEDTCNVTIVGVDAEKCYSFRVRAKPLPYAYQDTAQPSEWSAVTLQQGGQLTDACSEEDPPVPFPKFMLISCLVALLTVLLLALFLWKLRRVQKLLIPSVPDPKSSFPGLFESHRGDFQEWIQDTQNVVPWHKMDTGEQDGGPEDALVVQLSKDEAQRPAMTARPSSLQTGVLAASGGPQPAPGGELVCLGDVTFVMDNNAYMML
ncbi:cytokine receptor-like factor 2 [Talpa occidentalis]|uniref:cytokine receptor-like factor 2 n=1 Tax=Talpa occidentalis TaxID=50954 RepID=UPI00188E8C55|nr:cytokine receptor-like factor 2 [Talpa occidentalis]